MLFSVVAIAGDVVAVAGDIVAVAGDAVVVVVVGSFLPVTIFNFIICNSFSSLSFDLPCRHSIILPPNIFLFLFNMLRAV